MMSEYVCITAWQPEQGSRPLLMPSVSLHGPPFQTPQWKVCETCESPLTSSMMSISPMLGQLVAPTPRAAEPIAQKAGQYPSALAGSGCCNVAVSSIAPPAGAAQSVRAVSIRPDVQ